MVSYQQQAQDLRFGGRMHTAQGVGKAQQSDRGGQGQRRPAEHQCGGEDIQDVHYRPSLMSGTRNRAMLTDPTKLIRASAARL